MQMAAKIVFTRYGRPQLRQTKADASAAVRGDEAHQLSVGKFACDGKMTVSAVMSEVVVRSPLRRGNDRVECGLGTLNGPQLAVSTVMEDHWSDFRIGLDRCNPQQHNIVITGRNAGLNNAFEP